MEPGSPEKVRRQTPIGADHRFIKEIQFSGEKVRKSANQGDPATDVVFPVAKLYTTATRKQDCDGKLCPKSCPGFGRWSSDARGHGAQSRQRWENGYVPLLSHLSLLLLLLLLLLPLLLLLLLLFHLLLLLLFDLLNGSQLPGSTYKPMPTTL